MPRPHPSPGWRWSASFWRLVAFAALLMPGFAQMIVFYFFSPRMLRSVPYGLEVGAAWGGRACLGRAGLQLAYCWPTAGGELLG